MTELTDDQWRELGEVIANRRADMGRMSQAELCRRAKVAQRTLVNIETGQTRPQRATLRRVLQTLELPTDLPDRIRAGTWTDAWPLTTSEDSSGYDSRDGGLLAMATALRLLTDQVQTLAARVEAQQQALEGLRAEVAAAPTSTARSPASRSRARQTGG